MAGGSIRLASTVLRAIKNSSSYQTAARKSGTVCCRMNQPAPYILLNLNWKPASVCSATRSWYSGVYRTIQKRKTCIFPLGGIPLFSARLKTRSGRIAKSCLRVSRYLIPGCLRGDLPQRNCHSSN